MAISPDHISTPRPNNNIGHFADQKGNKIIDNKIYSSTGNREGEVFKGKCYQADVSSYIDVSSFVTGTLTAKAWWVKDIVIILDGSLTYNEILEQTKDLSNATANIDLTTEVDDVNKYINLQSDFLYYGILVYEDGNLVALYNCEEGDGTTAYDLTSNKNNGTLVNIWSGFHAEDTDVPFSFLNEFGYSIVNNAFIPKDLSTPNFDVLGNPLENIGRVKPYIEITDNWGLEGDGSMYVDGVVADINSTETNVGYLGFWFKRENTTNLSTSQNTVIRGNTIPTVLSLYSINIDENGYVGIQDRSDPTTNSFTSGRYIYSSDINVCDDIWHKIELIADWRNLQSDEELSYILYVDKVEIYRIDVNNDANYFTFPVSARLTVSKL